MSLIVRDFSNKDEWKHVLVPNIRVQIVDPETKEVLQGTTHHHVDRFYEWVDVLLDNGDLKSYHMDHITVLPPTSEKRPR